MTRQLSGTDRGTGGRASAEQLDLARRRRRNRRLGAFGALLLLGLALGTVYATGFATTGGATGSESGAQPILTNPSNNQDTSGLNGLISSNGNLTWNWSGRWGTVDSKVMYEVDLSGEPAGDDFFSEVLLTNSPAGFSDLQLQLRIATDGGDGCDVADLTGTATSNYRVMVFDTNDAQVTFSGIGGATDGLPGGARYCIGIVDYGGSGRDEAGTFIRKSNSGSGFSGIYPTFVSTLNRMQ